MRGCEKELRSPRWWKISGQDHGVAVDYRKDTTWKTCSVRIAVEGTSAADMALRGTAADIARLRDLLSQPKASIKDHHSFAALDLEFHITIAKASGNSLFDLVSMIRGQLAGACRSSAASECHAAFIQRAQDHIQGHRTTGRRCISQSNACAP
jgi:DNA-binding FadR family transcriptional regulator